MTDAAPSERAITDPNRALMWLALLLFIGSGAAALIYEVVWFQLLQLIIGSSSLSLGVLLATFMGGMGLGSWLFARITPSRWHPLRVYAVLELAIGISGLAIVFLLPATARVYVDWVQGHSSGMWARAALASACLLLPTLCMGATLPAIARWMEATPQGVSRMGLFYAANIGGAVCGCLVAGFFLLRVTSLEIASGVALATNVVVAAIAVGLAARAAYRPPQLSDRGEVVEGQRWRNLPVYLSIGLSGFTALGAEVLWTRSLSLMLGATVYTFSLILSVFLVGLGIGSHVGSSLAGSRLDPRWLLAGFQCALLAGFAWASRSINVWLPYWPIDVSLADSYWLNLQLDVMRCLFAMFPAAFCWGASFPLAVASALRPGQDPARLVGGVYAANTFGAILGALLVSAVGIPQLGTLGSQRVLASIIGASSLIMLMAATFYRGAAGSGSASARRSRLAVGFVATILVAGAAIVVVRNAPAMPAGLIAFGRYLPTYDELPKFLYVGEGSHASIAVSQENDGTRNFHVSGKIVASSNVYDMRLQRMLSHLPALIHPAPKSVLVVGCGAGVTAGTFLAHPGIEEIVICEIEPLIPPAAGAHFSAENGAVIDDPRVEIVIDDARHYVATTNRKFDIITSDPIHPWVKGAATLYSEEYFALCQARLNPGGVVTQWVPLYETSFEAANSQVGTFMKAFPHGTIWGNEVDGGGYDLVLMAQVGPMHIDFKQWESRLLSTDHAAVAASLAELDLGSVQALLQTYAGQASDLQGWIDARYLNQDHSLKLQYLAGLSLNKYLEVEIYDSILAHRRYPENLLTLPATLEQALRIEFGPTR